MIEDVAKDLDKGVRLGNTFYLDEVEGATGLILQYEKKKQQEQRSNRYNKRNYNNNNNNNNNDDDKKNDDETKNNDDGIVSKEMIAAVIGEEPRNERLQHMLALIEGDGSLVDPDVAKEEWYGGMCNEYGNNQIIAALTDHDICKEINKEVTIADIQNRIEKGKQRSRQETAAGK